MSRDRVRFAPAHQVLARFYDSWVDSTDFTYNEPYCGHSAAKCAAPFREDRV